MRSISGARVRLPVVGAGGLFGSPVKKPAGRGLAAVLLFFVCFVVKRYFLSLSNENFGSAPSDSVSGRPSSFFTRFVPCTSATIL